MVRAGVSVGLLAGFFALALVSAAGLGGLAVWAFAHAAAGPVVGVVALLLLATLLLLIGRLAAPPAEEPVGVATTPDQAPELWSTVGRIAEAVGVRVPQEIRLTADSSATVAEPASLLGLRGGPRTLLLGLPLVQGLRVAELQAVLAYALALQPRNRVVAASLRGEPAIARAVPRLDPVTRWMMRGYQRLYISAHAPVRRHQEAIAEQAMIQVAGPGAATAARRAAPALADAWQSYLDTYVNRGAEPGLAPAGIMARFPDLLASRPSREPVDDDRPATALLPQAREVAAAVDAAAFALPGRQRVSFEEYAVHAARAAYRRDGQALHEVAAGLAGQPVGGLGTVLDLIGAGRRADLARGVARGDEPGGARLAAGLRDLLVIAMVDAGSARLVHSWSRPHAVIGRNGDELDVGPLVTLLLAEPPDVATVRTCLSAMGVDLAP